MEKEPKPRKRIPLEEVKKGISENPWVDEVGYLKDKKAHLEVYRMLQCNCEHHEAQAIKLIDKSYIKAFGKFDEESCDLLKELYELRIVKDRNNEKGLKRLTIVDFTVWGKKNPT